MLHRPGETVFTAFQYINQPGGVEAYYNQVALEAATTPRAANSGLGEQPPIHTPDAERVVAVDGLARAVTTVTSKENLPFQIGTAFYGRRRTGLGLTK